DRVGGVPFAGRRSDELVLVGRIGLFHVTIERGFGGVGAERGQGENQNRCADLANLHSVSLQKLLLCASSASPRRRLPATGGEREPACVLSYYFMTLALVARHHHPHSGHARRVRS